MTFRTLFIIGLVYGFCYTAFEIRAEFANMLITKHTQIEMVTNQ